MRNVIFDLDLTIVNTSLLEDARQKRDWNMVYSMIPQCQLYEGMKDVLNVISKHNVNACIISTAPKPYIEKIVDYFQIPIQFIIGYHDVKPIKPHPASFFKAIQIFGCTPTDCISFGDRAIDIQASNAAGIESVACFWGTHERKELLYSGYSHAIISPNEILTLIR